MKFSKATVYLVVVTTGFIVYLTTVGITLVGTPMCEEPYLTPWYLPILLFFFATVPIYLGFLLGMEYKKDQYGAK